ncbi:MAG TPA: type II CAAX endopeptidase family protein [Rhodanobacter sp.]
MSTDTFLTPPAIPPAQPLATPVTRAPDLWSALGLVALYFVLQAVGSGLIALVLGMAMGFVHPWQRLADVGDGIRSMLDRPGMPALLVILTLSLAAVLILVLARQRWPHLWSLAQPPGFGFVRAGRPLFFALAVVIGLAAPLFGGWLTQLLAHGQTVTQNIQQLGADTPPAWRIVLVLVVVSVGPVVEELLFRGVLLSALWQRWRTGWAVALSSLMFALVHLPGLQWQWFALPDLLLLALALAWLRLRSGSIWPGVLAHGVHNLLTVAAWFVAISLPG